MFIHFTKQTVKNNRGWGFSIDSYEVSRPATHSTSLLRPWKWALNVTTTLSENVGKTPWAIAIRLIIIIPLKWPILEVYPPDTSIYWWIVVISCNILTLSIQNPKQKWFYHSRISLTFSGLLTANHGLHSCLIHRLEETQISTDYINNFRHFSCSILQLESKIINETSFRLGYLGYAGPVTSVRAAAFVGTQGTWCFSNVSCNSSSLAYQANVV